MVNEGGEAYSILAGILGSCISEILNQDQNNESNNMKVIAKRYRNIRWNIKCIDYGYVGLGLNEILSSPLYLRKKGVARKTDWAWPYSFETKNKRNAFLPFILKEHSSNNIKWEDRAKKAIFRDFTYKKRALPKNLLGVVVQFWNPK